METHRKPGPRKQYGERQDVRLLLPVELLGYIDSVTSNRTKWLIEAAQEKQQREEESKEMGRYTNAVRAQNALTTALENYLKSDDFKSGIIASTRASWSGSGYSVELFYNGSWRNLWNNQIGNKYESEGVILRLPTLDTDDMSEYVEDGAGSEDDFLSEAFENEQEELAAQLRQALK